MEKIKFSDLSVPIKIAVISSYIVGILYVIAFVAGYIIAMVE